MPDFSLCGGRNRYENAGSNAADSAAVTITSNAAANTKGPYGQLIASTAFNTTRIFLSYKTSFTDPFLFDVAVGAAASEQVVIANIQGVARDQGVYASLPLYVPAGSRISARCQDAGGIRAMEIGAVLSGEGFEMQAPLSRVTTYGANTADSGGTSIDPGGVAHTKGAYSQLSASITSRIRQLYLAFGEQDDLARATSDWLLDIAVGAAASEEIFVPDIYLHLASQLDTFGYGMMGPFPVNIPKGSRLAARSQCSGIDASDRLFDLIAYGVD